MVETQVVNHGTPAEYVVTGDPEAVAEYVYTHGAADHVVAGDTQVARRDEYSFTPPPDQNNAEGAEPFTDSEDEQATQTVEAEPDSTFYFLSSESGASNHSPDPSGAEMDDSATQTTIPPSPTSYSSSDTSDNYTDDNDQVQSADGSGEYNKDRVIGITGTFRTGIYAYAQAWTLIVDVSLKDTTR